MDILEQVSQFDIKVQFLSRGGEAEVHLPTTTVCGWGLLCKAYSCSKQLLVSLRTDLVQLLRARSLMLRPTLVV